MNIDRRTMLGAAAVALPLGTAAASPPSGPDDEAGWAEIARLYDLPDGIVQLENAYWGAMARPVREEYQRQVAEVNRQSSYYGRLRYGDDYRRVKVALADRLRISPDEIALTRNATEALKALIGQYDRLRPGETVLIADLDYDSMQAACAALAKRCGANLVRIALPEPASRQGLIDAYARAMDAHPRLRLMLLTHIGHRTGLMLPVREIVAMARAKGIDVIVDAAHSWGQADFALPDLDADFVGLNGHKWIGAPLGVGILHIRKGRIDAIGPDPADDGAHPESVEARVHTGTLDFAAQLTVPAALAFQARIGSAAKATRLRALRDRWAEAVRGLDGLDILTPSDPALACAITAFRIRGLTSVADNVAVSRALLERHRIFTIHRAGPARGACVRVTPGIYTRMEDMDAMAAALRDLVPRMAKRA
ncbi:aminotransferase class V-fold PLP-dependent enzyme [Sphingobium ummariense]